jgi:hypothetical protein
MRRMFLSLVVAAIAFGVTAPAAQACGSLVAANGAVDLVRTTTLAAYSHGVEHYITSFEFTSGQPSFGSIIPLPAAPTKVEKGGAWTLQRLEREVNPPKPLAGGFSASTAVKSGVQVLQRKRIDSLDITIVKGGGRAVAAWTVKQGFALSKDSPAVLDFYSRRSPYFMTARFDATAAVAQGFKSGDGVPVHLTIPTGNPWVPLRILATAKAKTEEVNADVFLLTDREPALLAGRGPELESSGAASASLLDDLRADRGMAWVPQKAWLDYLTINERAGNLRYDLAADVSSRRSPSVADTGLTHVEDLAVPHRPTHTPWAMLSVGAVLIIAAGCGAWLLRRRRTIRPRMVV